MSGGATLRHRPELVNEEGEDPISDPRKILVLEVWIDRHFLSDVILLKAANCVDGGQIMSMRPVCIFTEARIRGARCCTSGHRHRGTYAKL